MSISRRSALIGASAAVVTGAAVVPLAMKAAGVKAALAGDDAALLAQVARFHDVYDKGNRVWAKQKAHRALIEAMPDCPRISPWSENNAHFAFLEAHDAYRYWDECNRLNDLVGALANAIFETPARTLRDVLEKLKIAHIALGNYDEDGDTDLEVFQDRERPWMETVIADLERLAGGLPS
ncbi:MAG: hypothetical protein IIB66_03905 [Proteobacteria bacterium]|nr:hypothetical protein [Pseudomonadota bacterium]